MSLIRFLFIYAALIWFSNATPSLIQKLQIIQNFALPIATCWVKMTSIDHLHEKTKMLSVVPNILPEISNLTTLPIMYSPPPWVSDTRKKAFNFSFSIMLHSICWAVFYPLLIMGSPSSPFILKAMSDSKSLLTHNRVLQTATLHIAPE